MVVILKTLENLNLFYKLADEVVQNYFLNYVPNPIWSLHKTLENNVICPNVFSKWCMGTIKDRARGKGMLPTLKLLIIGKKKKKKCSHLIFMSDFAQ